ncbi:MAG: hypothetical protein MPK62_07280 [Alphaproteobacteria bacterium]|nr:hypothetical protein [Alphaproteobacteria bacterium]
MSWAGVCRILYWFYRFGEAVASGGGGVGAYVGFAEIFGQDMVSGLKFVWLVLI